MKVSNTRKFNNPCEFCRNYGKQCAPVDLQDVCRLWEWRGCKAEEGEANMSEEEFEKIIAAKDEEIAMLKESCGRCPAHAKLEAELDEIMNEPKQERGWIPVGERLPEQDGNYLIFKKTFYGHHMEISQYAKDRGQIDEFDMIDRGAGFYSYDSEWGYCCEEDVTHWMPLPEAPGKGE